MKVWDFYTSNEIKPRGWLKTQLEIQAKGLSGNLDKIWPDVRDSKWIGGTAEGWERVPYWLDGFIPLAYLLQDDDMICRAETYIHAIIDQQKPDGWICPCEDNERASYDTWAVLLITKVLTVYYECSGNEAVIPVIYRTMKNFYNLLKDGIVHLFDWGEHRWFEGFIALDLLKKTCDEPWITELAHILKEQGTDYAQKTNHWKVPLNNWTQDTHIVNLTMMLKSEAVSCDILGEPYTDLAETLYEILYRHNGTPVGLFTGDECLSGRSPIQGTELCAVVEQMYSYERLFAYTGERKWAERLEMLAFNALPATISDDMWAHQYDQMSNQIACQRFPGKAIFRTNDSDAHLFGLEPNFGCCTSNFNQGWPKLALSAFMHNGDTIISALPVPSELTSEQAHITLDTLYPFENRFVYRIEAKSPLTFAIRLPSSAKNVTVDGKEVDSDDVGITLEAGQVRELTVAFETVPQFVSTPVGLTAAKCGSLVFSLPIEYKAVMFEYEKNGVERKFPYCDYEYVPQSTWGFGYCDTVLTVERHPMGEIPFSSKQPPIILKATVKPIDWGFADGYETVCAKLPLSTEPTGEATEVALYPYGCAKLRMTELPML